MPKFNFIFSFEQPFELKKQMGSSGVDTLFEYAIEAVRSGGTVKVTYNESGKVLEILDTIEKVKNYFNKN